MAGPDLPTSRILRLRSLGQWRDWLSKHHASTSEVWLILHKRHARATSIAYQDARDEALCFGWVDSLVRRIDEERYALKFTPRRADSRWSDVNRKRYAALEAEGRMTPAGLERPPTDRGYGPRPQRLELPTRLPAYIQEALEGHPPALRQFKAASRRTAPLFRMDRIGEARRDETPAPRGSHSPPRRRPRTGAEIGFARQPLGAADGRHDDRLAAAGCQRHRLRPTGG